MSSRRISQLKPFLGLLVFLALWWIIPPTIKLFTRASFYEFQAPFTATASHLRDLQTYWSLRGQSDDSLIEAGRDLARINAQYNLSRQQMESLQDEVNRLEALLELPSESGFRYEIARVAKRDLTAWWQQFTIRKGRNYGIPEGAAVVYAGGVVGRIREVHAYTSVVELVSSPGFRMAASLEGENRPVTYQGLPNPPFVPPIGEAMNIPPDIRVSPAEPRRLVSSRLGGVFPEGLAIGLIAEVEPGSDGYFQKGIVQLDPELTTLKEVAVVMPLNGEEEVNDGS
ncbi:rod shape-determining protein MreC [Rubellicoccus peritrichatus]|uniref:Cell shape-determining protein MreC n=1 Tax=Rubellicoccus peritrichatus TaxID=3080537 RepID=A0AAQ3L9G0_9BACT|nr:rod shape-determining protein MreC [Puniceicoccus sp. CR14]WOO41825.1 rod shape-determining protein MreC [Puniceicoccus sp. CR14]